MCVRVCVCLFVCVSVYSSVKSKSKSQRANFWKARTRRKQTITNRRKQSNARSLVRLCVLVLLSLFALASLRLVTIRVCIFVSVIAFSIKIGARSLVWLDVFVCISCLCFSSCVFACFDLCICVHILASRPA